MSKRAVDTSQVDGEIGRHFNSGAVRVIKQR